MGLQIFKKEKTKQKEQTVQGELPQMVDRYVELAREIAEHQATMAPKIKEMERYAAKFRELGDTQYLAEEEFTLKGLVNAVLLSKKGKKATIKDRELLKQYLGEAFDTLWAVGITDTRKYLTPPQLEEVLDEKYENARTVKVIDLE